MSRVIVHPADVFRESDYPNVVMVGPSRRTSSIDYIYSYFTVGSVFNSSEVSGSLLAANIKAITKTSFVTQQAEKSPAL